MKLYSFRTVTEYTVTLKRPKKIEGSKEKIETEVRFRYTYYGVIGPFVRDYVIMNTENKKEAIFHTEKELNRVSELLERNKIKFCIFEVEGKKEQEINIALYEK
jgi:hypothetical protein